MESTNKLIYFNSRDSLIRIPVSKIVYFESDGNYTYVVVTNKLKACLSMNLSHTEQAMSEQLGGSAHVFMRIGKRFIINMRYIYQIDMAKQQLILSDFENFTFFVPVSKDALKNVKQLLIHTKI